MEVELQRKIITLEDSVKDIDERLAELYRETAGLTLQKSTILRKVKRDANTSKKHAGEVKRIHTELKSGLSEVSGKLERMDAVIKKLNSMRREARKEKSKEVAELATSLLKLNKKLSKINRLINDMRAEQHDPRIDVLQKELSELRKLTSGKPGKKPLMDMEAAVSRLEELASRKIDNEQLQAAVSDANRALSAEMVSLRKNLAKSLEEFDARLDDVRGHAVFSQDKLSELETSQSSFSKSLSSLEKQLKDMEDSIFKFSKGAKAGVASPIDLKKLRDIDKKINTVRERANSILKEIYDNMDALKTNHADFSNLTAQNAEELQKIREKLSLVEKQIKTFPRSAGEGPDITGLVAEIEELRSYVNTLVKGLDISKALAEELKAAQLKMSAMESWKTRMEDFPRELERLAERLAELETTRAPSEGLSAKLGKAETDMKNLKLTIAELSNKLRLIDTLALENQKMQHKLFVLEDRLPSGKTVTKDN